MSAINWIAYVIAYTRLCVAYVIAYTCDRFLHVFLYFYFNDTWQISVGF